MKTTRLLALLAVLAASLAPRLAASPAIRFEVPASGYERNVVAACLVLEAANQGELGMRAVMAVILNRSRQTHASLYAVATAPRQFSCLNGVVGSPSALEDLARQTERRQPSVWQIALNLVDAARRGELVDPTRGATFYHRSDVAPAWAGGMRLSAVIGAHAFYRKA